MSEAGPSPRRGWAALASGALLLGLTAAVLVPRALRLALTRDAGEFQYIAWALRQGEVDYRDLHDMNAPLSHAIHWALSFAGGLDDRAFRALDLACLALASAAAGALLPRPGGLPRAVSALYAAALLATQYLLYGAWSLSQRDAMALWFVLPATALAARCADDDAADPARGALLAGALDAMACTVKPFFGAVALAHALALALAPGRRRAVPALALGGALGLLPALAFVLALGDLGEYLRMGFRDGPAVYAGLLAVPFRDVLARPGFPFAWIAPAAVASAVTVALVAAGRLRRRELPFALLPAAGVAMLAVQGKGFHYHLHPLTAGLALLAARVVALCHESVRARVAAPLASAAAALGLASLVPTSLLLAPETAALQVPWRDAPEPLPYVLDAAVDDYHPRALARAVDFLRAHTRPGERVFLYSPDTAILLKAGRLGAAPSLVHMEFNLGGQLAPGAEAPPTPRRRRIMAAFQADNVRLALRGLARPDTTAAVITACRPGIPLPCGLRELEQHTPALADAVRARFRLAADFGALQVWLPP